MSKPETGVPVRILGEEYRLAGASPDRVRALAEYVDRRYRETLAARPTMDMKRLAVVVCLTIAEELFEERARGEARHLLESDAARRVRRCRDLVEAAWANSAPGDPRAGPREPE